MGWIGFDLDGTLAHYDQFRGMNHIGQPIPKMVAILKQHLEEGDQCKIMTARAGDEKRRERIKQWLKQHDLPELQVTDKKDYKMWMLYDDRRVSVKMNSGQTFDYNKKEHGMQLKQAVRQVIKQLLLQKKKQAPKGTNIRTVLKTANQAGRVGASWTQLHNAVLGKRPDSKRSSRDRGKNISRINRRAGRDNGRDDQGQIDDSKYADNPLIKKNEAGKYVITQRGIRRLNQLDDQLGKRKKDK